MTIECWCSRMEYRESKNGFRFRCNQGSFFRDRPWLPAEHLDHPVWVGYLFARKDLNKKKDVGMS